MDLRIQIILVPFQQGINNNSFILTNDYYLNSIFINDIIALKTTLDNVLINLNARKIKDTYLINHNTMPKGASMIPSMTINLNYICLNDYMIIYLIQIHYLCYFIATMTIIIYAMPWMIMIFKNH